MWFGRVEGATDLPITAMASGSLNPVCLSFVSKVYYIISPRLVIAVMEVHTRQIEEVGLLVKLVKHSARPVLRIGRRKHGDAVLRQLACEGGAAGVVLEGGDAGGY